jgi:uncharacterized protein
MMGLQQSDAVEIRTAKGKGRGVFARRTIREGEEIERVPVLVMSLEEVQNGPEWTTLGTYCFMWERNKVAVALGYGSLYNHSYRPNARYDDVGRQTKVFTALRDIGPGEEITVNYNGDPADRTAVGFDVVETARAATSKAKAKGARTPAPPQPGATRTRGKSATSR